MSFADATSGRFGSGRTGGGRTRKDEKHFYFFHMPKTGGRTIEKHIQGRFGPGEVLRPARNKTFYAECFARRKYILSRQASDAHIVGHFASWTLLKGREQKYYKACFWRHPADWFLSFYNYRLHRNAKKIYRRFDFADFYKSMLRNSMTKHFLLYCGDVPGWTFFFMSDREKFELACSLAERFDCFSDIANVDSFIEAIGFKDESRPADYNRIPSHEKALASLDEAIRAEIERANSVDFYMHKLAQSEDRLRVVADAQRALNPNFDPRDILRLMMLPYYCFKTWVLPFMAFPAAGSQGPTGNLKGLFR